MKIKFTVYGIPVPKARARITKRGNFTPDKTAEWEEMIRGQVLTQIYKKMLPLPFLGPVGIRVRFYLPSKRSLGSLEGPPRVKKIKEKYLSPEGIPRAEIEIWSLPEDDFPKRGDLDNFYKAVADALQGNRRKGWAPIAFLNDSQVVHMEVDKMFV